MSVSVITYDRSVGRWTPDADDRLREAAIELFIERGYEETTVADIAEKAGLTPRTFFRHFSDKREVLFSGSEELERRMVAAVDATPTDERPIAAITAALEAAATVIGSRKTFSR